MQDPNQNPGTVDPQVPPVEPTQVPPTEPTPTPAPTEGTPAA